MADPSIGCQGDEGRASRVWQKRSTATLSPITRALKRVRLRIQEVSSQRLPMARSAQVRVVKKRRPRPKSQAGTKKLIRATSTDQTRNATSARRASSTRR